MEERRSAEDVQGVRPGRTTILDLARHLGVSASTISRAMHNRGDVSAATRRRVLDAAEQFGYVADPRAAGLPTGKTSTVAILTTLLDRWYFGQAISAVQAEAAARGFDVALYGLEDREDISEALKLSSNLYKRVDGVVVVGLVLLAEEIDRLSRLHLPTVAVGLSLPGVPSVRIDHMSSVGMAVGHLLELGHRRIAYLGCQTLGAIHPDVPTELLAAFRAAVARAGLSVDACDIVEVPGATDFDSGRRAAGVLLDRGWSATAALAASDEMAMGIVHEFLLSGTRVPEDISVIGHDGHELTEGFRLSTVAKPVTGLGTTGSRMLLDWLDSGVRPRDAVLDCKLIARSSTAPPQAR